ncbi:hypothetical protein [Clavibacter sp. MX14-G9D]|uniref:hypothetical protein n=1 Tax=Clavibacter sp. MX14-G9D TaxID=3064656 RepID=UPI00293EA62B|nr:hypothetical protein [Clavibacter sp. MX14-G9D]
MGKDMSEAFATDAHRRASDRRVTAGLLVTQLLVAGAGYFCVLMSGMAFGGCAERARPCDYGLGDFAFELARWGLGVSVVLTVVGVIGVMAAGRRTRAIPALGTALVLLISIISLVLTGVAIA